VGVNRLYTGAYSSRFFSSSSPANPKAPSIADTVQYVTSGITSQHMIQRNKRKGKPKKPDPVSRRDVDFSQKELGVSSWLVPRLKQVGCHHPTKIQLTALQALRKTAVDDHGPPLMLTEQTGTGKTLAFVLPLLSQLDVNMQAVQAVICVPTRELANQVLHVINGLMPQNKKSKGLMAHEQLQVRSPAQLCVGEGPVNEYLARQVLGSEFRSPPQVLVGTPESLKRILVDGLQVDDVEHSYRISTADIKFIVFDEADRLLQSNRLFQWTMPLVRWAALKSEGCKLEKAASEQPRHDDDDAEHAGEEVARVVFSSATLTKPVHLMMRQLWPYVAHITGSSMQVVDSDSLVPREHVLPVSKANHYFFPLTDHSMEQKVHVLVELLLAIQHQQLSVKAKDATRDNRKRSQTTIVFFAKWPVFMLELVRELERHPGLRVGTLSEYSRRSERREALKDQRNVILCTADMCRGLDLKYLTHVVNFDVPRSAVEYIHQAGRVGRVGALHARNTDSANSVITLVNQFSDGKVPGINVAFEDLVSELKLGDKIRPLKLRQGLMAVANPSKPKKGRA
jgi:superfamily II DNA/RNA helicase